ncbi:tetratricopeptide repeat-containing sensor histidine kinase [Saccharicrinis aurantiacus]|uniref:tetratricopeptide repeat-containing sensor histidine kinase n=1 Tax=Saccharicrinis aurantiacus TaxID=1849719 RepID=UPI0024905D3F|nr:tetratricopeptide repeat-containing sensor histidine kinase [Saccharicrinis aurantiacus]
MGPLLILFSSGLDVSDHHETKNIDRYRQYYENFYETDDPEMRFLFADSAYIIAKRIGDKEREARAILLKAITYRHKGDFLKAIDLSQISLDLYSNLNDNEGIAACYQEIATLYHKNNEQNNAVNSYFKALNLYEILNDTLHSASVNLNLGECMRLCNKFDSALYYYKRAYDLFDEIDFVYGLGYTEGNIGLVYIELSQIDSAKVKLIKGMEILKSFNDNYAISSYYEGLARVFLMEGDFYQAQESANKSMTLAKEHGLLEQIRDTYLTLSKIYSAEIEYERAYNSHCQYVIFKDSINNEETVRKIANLRTKYEVAQKQKEVDALVNQKERYTIIGISLFVVLFLLLAHVAHLYRNRRLRKRDATALAKQHKELEIANDTKNKFFSILSHDLRSPIATFNSYSEVLNYYLETNDYEQIPQLAKELERSSASVVQLLDNLLQWGVIQMKNIKINKVNVPILQVFQEELIHIQPIANSKDIQIQSNIASDLELHVDKPFFAMTMRNLISNSLKFTKVGGFITVSAYREKDHIIVKVADTGIGLEVADFKKRLCSGDIASTYGTNNEKGLGLGLQLVCNFIESHGAEIDVESIIGKGTTFILKFKNTILS